MIFTSLGYVPVVLLSITKSCRSNFKVSFGGQVFKLIGSTSRFLLGAKFSNWLG